MIEPIDPIATKERRRSWRLTTNDGSWPGSSASGSRPSAARGSTGSRCPRPAADRGRSVAAEGDSAPSRRPPPAASGSPAPDRAAAADPAARPAVPPPVVVSLFEEPTLDVIVPAGERPGLLDALAAEVAALRPMPAPGLDPDADGLRRGVADGPPDVRRRGARGRRGPDRPAVRRPGRGAPDRHDHQGDGPDPRGGLHRQRPQVATAREPDPAARRDGATACPTWSGRSRSSGPSSSACSARRPPRRSWRPPSRSAGSGASGTATGEIPTIVTYHPSALLRNPAWKRDAWEDLQTLMNAMGLKAPDRKRPG